VAVGHRVGGEVVVAQSFDQGLQVAVHGSIRIPFQSSGQRH
jgi:hypothetical protein